MGNAELKTAFKNALKDQQPKEKLGLTAEILLEDELVKVVEEFIKEKMGVTSLEKEKAFPENNIQTNENAEDIYKRQLISELNENYISGFATAESNIESLKEPSFEKHFTVNSPEPITEYTKLQQQKFVILYALFVEKYREQQDKKQNFFEYIQKFLEKSDVNQRVQVGLESGFKFSLSLLKEIKSINKDMLVNSLEYLYQTLRYAEPGSLYSTDKLSFMIDSNLNDARTFLVSIIEDQNPGTPQRAIELAFKIIFLLGVVRSNVEDLLLVATLLDRFKVEVDLREEIDLLKEEEDNSSGETTQKKNFSERKVTKTGTIFYLKKNPVNEKVSFACDGQFLYVHQEGLGLIKMGTGVAGQMIGQIYQHNSGYRSGDKVSLLSLNNKLYCRAEGIKPKPFVVINPVTLEEEKDEFELEKEDQNLEWKENEDTGRSLTYTPLLTDGNYIYVIAQKKAPKKKPGKLTLFKHDFTIEDNKEGEEGEHQDADDNSSKPPMLVIECYDPATSSFKFVREIFLYKNADFEPFIKTSNSVDFIKGNSFATNGQIFFIQRAKKAYFFDMKSGILIQKVALPEAEQGCKICFDFQNNQFYSIKEVDGVKMDVFTITNFKKAGVSFGFAKKFLTKRLADFRSQVFGESDSQIDTSKSNPSKLNLIQRIMKNVTTPVLIQHSKDSLRAPVKGEHLPQYLRVLILRYIEKSCQNFTAALDELKAQGKSSSEAEEHMMKFFKYPNATYLTHTLFQQVQENLDRNGHLVDSKKTSANLSEQYSLYFVLNILTANFQALSFCSISLPDLMDEEAYRKFLHSYKSCIVRIIEHGYTQDFEEGDQQDEMKMLWQEIYQICLNILSTSINLIYSDNKEIIKNLDASLKDVQNEKQAENCSISLNFLSMSENSKKLLQADSEELQLITKVFEQCCQIKSNEITKTIESNNLGKVSSQQDTSSTLVQASSKFIRGLSEQLIVQFCALSEQISSKQQVSTAQTSERDERDKKKLKEYDTMIANFFEHTANEISHSIKTLVTSLQTTLEEKKDDQWEGVTDQFEKYSSFMDSLFQFNSTFYQIVTLYVQTFSVFKLKTSLIAPITQSAIRIIKEISSFYAVTKKFQEKLNLGEDKDKLRKCFDSFSRNLTWFIGLVAYKLIKVKEIEKDQEKKDKESPSEKMQELIISSNLLSGGIENRFVVLFSNEVQQTLQDLIKVSNDQSLQKMLQDKGKQKDEDNLLQAIIHEGKNANVDRVIIYLQQILEKKVPFVPYARLGGADGMRMTRAAFSVMIKFSEFFEDFLSMVDEIDMKWEEVKGDEDKDLKIKDCMKALPHYEQIVKRWDSASKMRQWINEKKKNLIERIKKEVETEYTKKKEEEKTKAEEAKKKEEEEKAKKEEEEKKNAPVEEVKEAVVEAKPKEEEVVQIDTSSKKEGEVVAEVATVVVEQTGLTDEDKQNIEDQADQKFNTELGKIFEKIIEKAEFLTKLQVPASYLVKDPTKKKEGTLLIIKELNPGEEAHVEPEFDWKDRLKSWKQMQTSKGAIKSFTERKKEIFDSSVMSILACLQTPIAAQRIKKQVETVFLNASKRVAGLKLLGEIMGLELPLKHRYDLMNWFSSSLRGNKNQLSHYLDDLKGCGHHLEEKARDNFFSILRALIKQVKESKEDLEIQAILNSLKWKYLARDHGELRNLDIFRTLHEGDGKKDSKLKRAWGRPLKQEVISKETERKLPKEVIDLFEQVFLLTVGRIIKPDTGSLMKLKQKGTSIPTLEKAQSIIDENVSERLIAQAFDVIFKEFERYIRIMKMFKGVDWTIYVKMRNKERKSGDAKKEYEDENLLDEDELEEQLKKAEEEKKKQEEEEQKKKEEQEQKKLEEAAPKKEDVVEEAKVEEKAAEEKPVEQDGEKVEEKTGEEKVEEKKEGEEEKKEGEEEEQKEAEDLEEKEKQEAIKKQEERAEKEMKSIYKLYSESFLRRLLRLVEIFTSIATVSTYPLSMVQRVANPFQLETLLNLLILSSPRIKIVVLKVIQNLIKIAIPFEVFEETITIITKDTKSQAYEILNKVIPSVEFEQSKFLKFLYNYLLSVRHKMWTKSGIESEGQYAVTQEIAHTLREILENDDKHQNWRAMISEQLKKNLLKAEDLSLEEIDVVFSIISGGDFLGIQPGQQAVTKDNQFVTILGFSDDWKQQSELQALGNEAIAKLKLSIDLKAENQKIVALFFDPSSRERQELMLLNLFDAIPIIDADNSNLKKMAQMSILNDVEIIKHFISILAFNKDELKVLSEKNKVHIKQLQLHVLKSLTHMINVCGQDFLQILQSEGLLDKFITYLYETSEGNLKEKTLVPIDWIELKCTMIKKAAMESDLSLMQSQDQMTAFVQNGKQLVFRLTDPQTKDLVIQNTYLQSGINLHNIPKERNYECILAKDVVNVNFDSAQGRQYGLVFLDGQELIKLDEKTIQIMLHSQAILTTSDISAKELFTKMVEEAKKDDEKDAKERKLEGLLETVILFTKRHDYERVQQPLKIDIKPLFKDAPSAIEGLLRELKEWGDVDRDVILQRIDVKEGMKFSEFAMAAVKILKEVSDEKQKNKDKLKKLETDKKFKELEALQKKLADLEVKRAKDMDEKRESISKKLGLGGGEVKSLVKTLVEASVTLKNYHELPQVQVEEEALKSDEYLNVLKDDKTKESAKKLIEKYIKEPFKQEDAAEIKKKTNDQLNKLFYQSVKGFDESVIAAEYEQTLDTLCNMYSKRSFTNIINHAELEKLLPFLLKDKTKQKLFTCFLKMQFNEAVQILLSSGSKDKIKEIKQNIHKVFAVCEKDAEFSHYVKNFFYYELIETGKRTIQAFQEAPPGKVMDYFNTEEHILIHLNPYLLKFMSKIYFKYLSDVVLERTSFIPNLFNIHLGMALYFQPDTTVLKRIYKSILALLDFVSQNLAATVRNGSLQHLLRNELLHEIVSSIDFDYSEKKYTAQQKLLLEIHMKLLEIQNDVLEQALGQLDSNLESSIGILKVKRGKQVLVEKEKFNFLKYYIHYMGLEEHQKTLMKAQIETNHYAFDSKVLARFSMNQTERMDIVFSENCQLKDFSFVGVSNNSKGVNMDILDTEDIKKDFKEMGINKQEFYLFYPLKQQIVVSFGENGCGRLGIGSTNSSGPKMSSSTKELKPTRIFSSFKHTILIDKEGLLYKAGQVKHIGSENTEFTKTTLSSKVRLVACGKTTVVAITEDNKVFVHGQSKDGHLGPNTNYDTYAKMSFGEEDDASSLTENKIVAVSSGTHYTLFVTESGKLFGCGNRFLKEIGLDADNKIISIPLPEGLKVVGVWACMSKKQPLALIKVVNEQGEEVLMSAGRNELGLLGQGQGVKVSKTFKNLKYDYKNLKFTDISLHTDHVLAVTETGQLYAWGSNVSKRAGFNEDLFDGVFEPKKLDFLEKEQLKALRVSAGFDHSLVIFQDDETKQEKLYSIGFDEKNFNHLGISQQEAEDKDKYYREITNFRGFKILDFAAGYRTSFVLIEGDKDPLDNLYEHTIPEKNKKAKGILHFYKDEADKWIYVTEEEYEFKKDTLPALCFAIKCPIEDLETKNFPDLKALIKETIDEGEQGSVHTGVKCNVTDTDIKGNRYFTYSKINGDDAIINLSEKEFKAPNQFDINPQIYYRIGKPLKAGARLPLFDLKHFYNETAAYGLDIEISPDLEYVQNDQMIKLTQSAFDELGDLISKFAPECDQELLKEMDRYVKATLADKQIQDIKAKEDFKIQDMTFKTPKLKKLSEAVKRKRIELYLSFNNIFLELMPYIEIGNPRASSKPSESKTSMANIFYYVKPLILFSIKSKFIQTQINTLPTGDANSVDVRRRKAQKFVDTGKVDHTGEYTIYGQIYQQIKKDNPTFTNFRKNNTDDKTWSANFIGEGSIDAGGPYRESLTNICAELESDVLPLLIKTPNNRNNHGTNRDCVILNPASTSPTHLDMFKFFGCLVGFAIRSLSALPLHLPPLLWKQILGDQPEQGDLKGVDTYTGKIIEDLQKQSQKLSDQDFDSVVEETFVTRLSDGTEVELCKEGRERKVTKANLDEYIKLLLEKRFKESELQLKAVTEGVFSVIPLEMIKILTWEEVETRCCGDKIIEVAKLKSITNYSCCSDKDDYIERFWRVFETFTEEEKSLYLKFVWGRSRLPYDISTLRYRHTIYGCSHKGDKEFPEAHTCFFQLDLPKYTDDEVCKNRLITAITMCGEIDTDGSARYIENDEDDE